MRRRLSYKELELKNKLLQYTLASTKKELAHYKERVRVLEAYVSRTTKEIRNLTQDFQIIRNYVNELNEKLEEKQGKIAVITTRLKYYDNAHSPPSLQSLQYKKRKQGDNKQQTEASTKSAKKAGAQKGHKGVSRSHNPDRVMRHNFEHTPICECGNMMRKSGWKQRRITELIPYEFTSSGILCTNHINCRDQLCVNLDTGELILNTSQNRGDPSCDRNGHMYVRQKTTGPSSGRPREWWF